MKIYPDAKVLLTVRDQPESWVKSVGATIHRISVLSQKFETRLLKFLICVTLTKYCEMTS